VKKLFELEKPEIKAKDGHNFIPVAVLGPPDFTFSSS